ncbi:MAG TPA: NRDE family protein [Isosphaeraceae bacterium]|nr:NRDE family protein [Isosphaeraceae bacterium]
MCLVFLAFQADADFPVLVGANREESRRRPSTPPVCSRSESVRCVMAGVDRGPDGTFPEIGTWLGVNEAGLVVAVTNRRDGELAWADQVRSRGLLAVSLLGFDGPSKAVQFARGELAEGGFGGCNYLIANGEAAVIVQAPGSRRITARGLTPGIHAMTNLDLDDGDDPRIRFVHENLEPEQFVASARRICRDERIVIRGLERGTVSSSLILVGTAVRFYHIMGDPGAGEYEEYRTFIRPEISMEGWPDGQGETTTER